MLPNLGISNRCCLKIWVLSLFFSLFSSVAFSQAIPITGVWRGHIESGKGMKKKSATIEVKLVALGNKVFGTIYYFGSGPGFIRYSIKGGLSESGSLIYWQDHSMIKMNVGKTSDVQNFTEAMKYSARSSSPSPNILKMEGTCMLPEKPEMKIELRKREDTFFPDEWDAVISGQIAGGFDMEVLDSVWAIASEPVISGEIGIPAGIKTVRKVAEFSSPDSVSEETLDIENLPSIILFPEETLYDFKAGNNNVTESEWSAVMIIQKKTPFLKPIF